MVLARVLGGAPLQGSSPRPLTVRALKLAQGQGEGKIYIKTLDKVPSQTPSIFLSLPILGLEDYASNTMVTLKLSLKIIRRSIFRDLPSPSSFHFLSGVSYSWALIL